MIQQADFIYFLILHTKEKLQERGITNSSILCDRLLDESGVAIFPGVDFNRPVEEVICPFILC